MNKIALTLLLTLLLVGVVFAVPSIVINFPNSNEIIKYDDLNYKIDFNILNFDFSNPNVSIYLDNDSNIYNGTTQLLFNDTNALTKICSKYSLNDTSCNYDWNILNPLIPDNNYYLLIGVHMVNTHSLTSFTIDKNAPTISYKFPDNNKWIYPELANFTFNVSDATSGIDINSFVVYLDGNIFDTNNSTRFNYNSLTNVLDFNGSDLNLFDGNFYTLSLDVNDVAKNKTRIDLNFWVDKSGPYAPDFNLPLTQKDNNVLLTWIETIVTSDVNYFVWKKDSNDLNFYQLPGPINDLNYTDSNTLPDTNYCYFIRTINTYNEYKDTNIYCILIDQTAPLLNDFNGSPTPNPKEILFYFDANDTGIGVEKYWIKLSDTNWIDVSTTKKYIVNDYGDYNFTGKVTDFAGNDSIEISKIVSLTAPQTPPSGGGSPGGSGGGSVSGGTISITNSDINEIILEEEVEETVVLPEVVDSNVEVESTQNTIDTNSNIEEPTTGTGLFGLNNLIRISFWPILLIIGLFLLLLIISKRRNKEDSWGGGNRIMVEDDIDDLKVNMFSGKWGYKK